VRNTAVIAIGLLSTRTRRDTRTGATVCCGLRQFCGCTLMSEVWGVPLTECD
jgi:hypothetical protein